VVIKLLSNLNGHILRIAEQRNSQSEGMASTAAGSALYLRSAAASWALHAGLFCQLMELGLRGSRDVPILSDVMELFVLTMVDSKTQVGIGPLFNPDAASEPGSPQQLQLISLVCSLIKYMQTLDSRQQQRPEVLCRSLFSIMVLMIKQLSLAADSESEQSELTSPAVNLAGMSAWLVLLGRCCLLLAGLLKLTAAGAAVQLSPVLKTTLWYCEDSILSAQDWLQLRSTSAQFTAAGYSPKNLLQQLQSTAAALEGADAIEGLQSLSRGWIQAAAQALEALCVTLNTLAIPHACNNPCCSNLSGPSELQLVGRRSATCAGCLTARYCGNLCQRAHWKQHKPVCKALAEARQHSSAG